MYDSETVSSGWRLERYRRALGWAASVLLFTAAPIVHATDLTVNNTGDPASGNAANCAPGNPNSCTLRDALAGSSNGDSIGFAVGSNQTILLTSGTQLLLANGVSIDGSGSPGLAIDGNNATRVFSSSSPTGALTIADLTIAHGSITNFGSGGGISFDSADVALTRVRLTGNAAPGNGGAIYGNGGSLLLTDCRLDGNSAADGGAISFGGSLIHLSRTTVSGNSASQGGGIQFTALQSIFENTTFVGNSADLGGAVAEDVPTTGYTYVTAIANVTFAGNSASIVGADYYYFYDIDPGILNVSNTIFADGCQWEGVQISSGGNNLDAGTSCGLPAASSNAVLDLGALGYHGGPAPTVLPGPASAALDAGSDSACAAVPVGSVDQRGVARPQGAHCDAGAVEVRVCFVKHDAGGAADGTSWADAYTDLQSALGNAACDAIWVARGVYKPATYVDASSAAISFAVRPGLAVYGGFSGIGSQRDPAVYPTVLSGDIDENDGGTNGVDASWTQIAGDNSHHVVVMDGTTAAGPIDAGTVLDGFTITGGQAETYVGNGYLAGGLFCDGSGGGHACSPTLHGLVFSGNLAGDGGALVNYGDGGASSPTLSEVTFTGNRADEVGGLLAGGGAIYDDARNNGISSPILKNVTFNGNSAASCGGAIHSDTYFAAGTSSPVLNGVTFAGNTAFSAGALCNASNGGPIAPVLTNVIVWGNSSPTFNDPAAAAAPVLDHVIIQDGCPANATCTNLIGTDPLLGGLQDNGGSTPTLMIGAGSPAIDAGSDLACGAAPDPGADQRGLARPQGAHCDIGAVEATQLVLNVTDAHAFGFYGNTIQYVVTLQNTSTTQTISGVHVKGLGTAALDEAGTHWFCTVGNCTTAATAGAFADTAALQPSSSLTWIVNVPVLEASTEASATFAVRSDGAANVSDTDTLAIFRSGFEANP